MSKINIVCVGKPRPGNVKIARLGKALFFRSLSLDMEGGGDGEILLTFIKEVIPV